MNFMQKTILIIMAIIGTGLLYFAINNHKTISENVTIQSWNSFTKQAKKDFNTMGKAFSPKKGANGAMCASNASCNSGNCASGLCQDKFVVGGPCNNDGQCNTNRCIAGTCRRASCKYGESSPGICKLSPADTQSIILAATAAGVAGIIVLGIFFPPALPAAVPLSAGLFGAAGGIAAVQTNQELSKQNKARLVKNEKRKAKVKKAKLDAEKSKLDAENAIKAIEQAEFEAEMEQLSTENKTMLAEIEQEKKQLAKEKNQLAEQVAKLNPIIEALQLRMDEFDAIAQEDQQQTEDAILENEALIHDQQY